MKVRFEIFKSFIRVDLHLQLEVEVDLPRQIRVFKAFFKQDKRQFKKKDGRVPPPWRHPAVFFLKKLAFVLLKKCFKSSDLAGGRVINAKSSILQGGLDPNNFNLG